jgi:hypothetical protein
MIGRRRATNRGTPVAAGSSGRAASGGPAPDPCSLHGLMVAVNASAGAALLRRQPPVLRRGSTHSGIRRARKPFRESVATRGSHQRRRRRRRGWANGRQTDSAASPPLADVPAPRDPPRPLHAHPHVSVPLNAPAPPTHELPPPPTHELPPPPTHQLPPPPKEWVEGSGVAEAGALGPGQIHGEVQGSIHGQGDGFCCTVRPALHRWAAGPAVFG